MATITKQGDTFRIKVYLGYDKERKQIVKSTTYKPPKGVSTKKTDTKNPLRNRNGFIKLRVIIS